MPDPTDEQSLEEEYTVTINAQRDYLHKLQDAFNAQCDQIEEKTKVKLKDIPASDKETKQVVYVEQKKELDEALAKLKKDINASARDTRKKLEEINTKREAREIKELEEMIQNIDTDSETETKDD
jgi:ABC-type Mn2+/Zn2+ transport system ATPase subunit